jgi:hypothetical protein
LIVSGKVGVGTTAPAAVLEVNGTAKFDGLVTFDSAQTFPGTGKGTITGVTASSPLTGGGTSGTVTVGLNTTTLGTTLETTFDNRYALLAGRIGFSDYVNAEAAEGTNYFAFYGVGSNGSGGVYGSSDSGVGVTGVSDGNGVAGFSNTPVAGQAGVFGTAGISSATAATQDAYAGVWGDTGVDTSTSSYYPIGVLGTADNGYAGDFVNDSATIPTLDVYNRGTGGLGSAAKGTPGLFTTIKAGSATGTCGIGGGSVSCTGPVKSLVSTAGSRTVETYATQSAENWMEDYGTGALARGVGVVQIDATFAQTVTGDASYHVFLTPHGDSKGLYVTNLTPTSFEVRESGGGTSTLSFDYKIVGKRRGYEQQRLVDVTDRFNAEEARTKGTLAKGKAHPTDGAVRRPSPAAMPMSGRPGGGVIVPQAAGTPNKTAAGAKPEVKGVVQK